MEKWRFRVNHNPKTISKNLASALEAVNGLVFNMKVDKNNIITFKMRKRILYAWYLIFLNSIIVHGRLLETNTANETDVEIYFNQHFLWKLVIFTHMILGLGCLITITSGVSNRAYLYVLGGILLILGIVLWFTVQNKYKKDVEEYKKMISKIMEI